jgi:hypothetical protein
MAGGYTNLDKVRPAGYRRFVDDAASPPQPDQQQQYEQVSIGSMSVPSSSFWPHAFMLESG